MYWVSVPQSTALLNQRNLIVFGADKDETQTANEEKTIDTEEDAE